MKHELFEELEAFNPRWQQRYATIRDASIAAGVLPLYVTWLETTHQGALYSFRMRDVPDYSVKRSSKTSLPYSLDNIGEVPDEREADEDTRDSAEVGVIQPLDWSEPED